jgi:hypothetical protein
MAQQIRSENDWTKHPDEVLRYTFDFSPNLLAGRKIASIATIGIVGDDSALSITTIGKTTEEIDDDDGNPIPVGEAVLVRISGGTPGKTYTLSCTITDDNPTPADADVIVLVVPLHIRNA